MGPLERIARIALIVMVLGDIALVALGDVDAIDPRWRDLVRTMTLFVVVMVWFDTAELLRRQKESK